MADVRIVLYAGLDGDSRLAVRLVRETIILLARNYGIDAHLDVTEVPVGDTEAKRHGLPLVKVNDEVVSQATIPSVSQLIDKVFEVLASSLELGPLRFPVFHVMEGTAESTA